MDLPGRDEHGFNVQWILSNLKEAREQLDDLIDDFETGEYIPDKEELVSQWRHAYYHLNHAWNGAEADETVWKCEDPEFTRQSRFDLKAFADLHPDWVDPGYGDD
jgi:hypothetical protein